MISTYHNGAFAEANPDDRDYISIVAPLGNAKAQEQTMRKLLLIVGTILILFAFSAFAQDNPSSPSASSPSAQSGSQSTQPSSGSTGSMSQDSSQSSQSSGSMSGGAAGEQTMEGCIVKQETDYYIQPTSGGAPTKVSGGDVASHVGHHVVVHGTQQASSASSAANPSSSSSAANPSSSSSSSSGDQTFNVTKVEMIATNCPASSKSNTGTSPDSANPK